MQSDQSESAPCSHSNLVVNSWLEAAVCRDCGKTMSKTLICGACEGAGRRGNIVCWACKGKGKL